MAEYISAQKDKRTFKDLVFDQLHKILELSSEEFRGGYSDKKIRDNMVEEIYIPDARKRISQAIEFLSFLLQPNYDEKMKTKSKEIKEKIKENLKNFNEEGDKKITREEFRIKKLNIMKKLFEELNFLLSRQGYLKGQTMVDSQFSKVHNEDPDEDDDEDDE